jgi:hypothetical protein
MDTKTAYFLLPRITILEALNRNPVPGKWLRQDGTGCVVGHTLQSLGFERGEVDRIAQTLCWRHGGANVDACSDAWLVGQAWAALKGENYLGALTDFFEGCGGTPADRIERTRAFVLENFPEIITVWFPECSFYHPDLVMRDVLAKHVTVLDVVPAAPAPSSTETLAPA